MPSIRSAVKKLVRRPVKDGAEDPNRAAAARAPTTQIETPKSSRERFGLFELFHPPSGQNVDIDIVAVHGIGGDWKDTWTKNRKLWLRDFLPGNLQSDNLSDNINARILSYGYESEYFITRGTTGIREAADSLLDRLNGQRLSGSERRPIIFVAHSLGGIVIKKAMNAANETSDYRNLKYSIIGVVFLGVPHRGADIAMWGTAVTEVMKTVSIGSFGSTELLKALKKDSDQLSQISDDWRHGVENLKIRTFYETKKLGPRLIVPQSSARLYFPREKCLPISDSDHRSMCRFDEDDKQRYEPLGRAVRDLAISAVERPRPDFVKRTLSKEESECLQALKTSDYEDYKHRANTPPRTPGTCQWCVKDERYDHWRKGHESSILWVSADPGCGKSVLASYLVDELKSSESQMILAGVVCHFFFKDDNEKQKDATYALSALLHQLFSEQYDLIKYGLEEFQRNRAFFQDFHSLWRIFTNATADPRCPNVVCIVDALDECQESTKTLLIRSLQDSFAKTRSQRNSVKFLLTSRPYPSIERKFRNFQKMKLARLSGEEKIAAIVDDIDTVIQERVNEVGIKRELSDHDKNQLASFLSGNAEKTFLWVSLVLEDIENDDDFNLTDIIENTPPSVYSYYENMLNKSSDRPGAEKIFHIVLAAYRPLTTEEMNCAYSTNLRTPDKLTLRSNIKQTIKGLCGLLLQIVDNKIHFIHQTAKEFLQNGAELSPVGSKAWKHCLNPVNSNIVLARVCISYLLLDLFKLPVLETPKHRSSLFRSKRSSTLEIIPNLKPHHFFLDYASTYWRAHFKEAQRNVETDLDLISMVLKVCDVECTCYHTWWSIFSQKYFYNFEQPNSILALSSYFGHEVIVQRLIENGTDIEARNSSSSSGSSKATALHLAAKYGHEAVVRLLLENGADIEARNSSSSSGGTALHLAARDGHEPVVRLLLERGADTRARNDSDSFGETALNLAARYRHEAVVRLLLEKGADIEARNFSESSGATALHLAARNGHEAVVRLLLKNGADTGARNDSDSSGATALHLAARGEHGAVVRLLLEKGADTKARSDSDGSGATALHLAAKGGHEAIVRLLLEKGADPKARNNSDSFGETALHLAARNRHEAVVRLLLEKGADIEARNNSDSFGETALHLAARNRHEAVVRLLLKNGADTGARNDSDSSGATALHLAARGEHGAVVRLLLENGADTGARNFSESSGETALHLAARNGYKAIVRLLLEKGADTKARSDSDGSGATALHLAAKGGHEAIVRLLLENGADIEARNNSDSFGETALHLAARNRQEAVVRLILEKGADIEARNDSDSSGATALHLAAMNGHEAVVRLILERGADINARMSSGSSGETTLHLAARNGYKAIVRLLLEKGADPKARSDSDGSGATALHLAAGNGHEAAVRLLLENGADIEAKEDLGRTPLLEATRCGEHTTVQLLLKNRANVHAKDEKGLTALHHAALKGSLDIFRLLLENGADVNIKDDVGMTAIDLAACDQDEALTEKLEGQGLLFTRYEEDDGSFSLTNGWEGRKEILQFIESSL